MLKTEINLELFKDLIYNPSDIETYLNLWSHELDLLSLSESERIELAKGWAYVTILYIHHKDELEYEYYTYLEDIYTLIYKYVKIDQTHPIDWEMAVRHILDACPHRREMLGILWVNRNKAEWVNMKEENLSSIIRSAYRHIEHTKAKKLRLKNKN